MGLIMACFAEVASQFREAGGPYLYARVALGRFLGLQMGWLAWLVRLTSADANANLFVLYLAEFWPQAGEPLPRALVLTLLLGILAAVNYRGVRAGAGVSDFFTAAKLLPLLIFIGVGLFAFRGANPIGLGAASADQWLQAVLVLVFAYGGFEAALMPMGEAKNPERDAPFALFTALVICTVVYTLIQVVVMQVLTNPAATQRPLAAAAREFMGGGAALIALGALISVYGYLSGQMLSVPRLTFALAERRDFPGFFARIHPRFRTPHVSIVIYTALVWILALKFSFLSNATLSAVARLFTYALVCVALLVLRRRQPGATAFRLPAGPLFAGLGIGFGAILVSRMGRGELAIIVATALVALLNWLLVRSREEPAKTS
jgi:amino acid transporter